MKTEDDAHTPSLFEILILIFGGKSMQTIGPGGSGCFAREACIDKPFDQLAASRLNVKEWLSFL